jgi:hypothetical protein
MAELSATGTAWGTAVPDGTAGAGGWLPMLGARGSLTRTRRYPQGPAGGLHLDEERIFRARRGSHRRC